MPRDTRSSRHCPPSLAIHGVVLADHIQSLDWRTRRAEFLGKAPPELVDDVAAKVRVLIGDEG